MSQVYDATRAGKTRMFREALARARAMGDTGMVRCCQAELTALGAFETTQDATALETPTPAAPRRGRRPKPRCEHNMIADRCETCNEGEGA